MKNKPITDRITQPSPQEVQAARIKAGLTQEQAAVLISTAQLKPYKTWQPYEVPAGQNGCRAIPLAAWELFLLLTDQHPIFVLGERKGNAADGANVDKLPEVNPNQLALPL